MSLPNSLYFNGARYDRVSQPTPNRYIGYRVLHFGEGGYSNPSSMPCVRPAKDAPPVVFTRALQLMSYELMQTVNPGISREKWRVVYGSKTAFTNEQGFDEPGDPRADYVNNMDLNEPLPKLMKALICSGMFIRGDIEGGYLVCKPGIHAIDANKPIPPVSEIVTKNWYFRAVTGGENAVFNFPQGGGLPVLIPFVLSVPVYYPLTDVSSDGYRYTNFEPWDRDYLPDPTKFYRA